jgi:3-oxoacyl-[acyl-carrier protein] reductase
MDLGLADKAAVVLASTSGLGRAVAEALLDEGASVAISGRDPGRLAETVAELGAGRAGRVWGEALDVTDAAALRAHLEAVRARWSSVQVLVTNAGGPPAATALELDEAGLAAANELTLLSAIRAIQTVLPWMRSQGWGRIVALTSMSVREPIGSLVYSNVMRTALTAYLKSLADQVAVEGVLVNSVCTGLFATDRLTELFERRAAASGRSVEGERAKAVAGIPVGRLGQPREMGALVAFLCSDRCSFLSGAALPYDGGAQRALL